MSLPGLEQRSCSQCHCGRVNKAFKPARLGNNGPKNKSVKCLAASSGVRVTKFRDGSVTYHFSEATDRHVEFEPLKHADSSLSLISTQQEAYTLNGAASAAPLQQQSSPGITSVRTTTTVVAEPRQRQGSRTQEQGQRSTASQRTSWSHNPKWSNQPRPSTQNGGNGQKPGSASKHKHMAGSANGHSARTADAQHSSILDSQLDFDKADTHLLLRAYSSRAAAGRLDAALKVLEGVVAAGRIDVLKGVWHKDFLRPAADHRAVSHAMRFVQLLPVHLTDARTYNMLVSVCIAARDLPMALQAGIMLRNTGRRLDTFLYTSLITACAMEGDTDAGFRLYEDMQAERVATDPRVYTALISVCSRKIQLVDNESGRRSQLVLLERAFGLFHDMQEARVKPDAAVWNALIAAAGRAGQLQRALDALQDMQDNFQQPDSHTFASLLNACRRAGDQTLALKVYHNALDAGCRQCLVLYDAAIAVCQSPVDLTTAMEIYADMQGSGVRPDERLYSSLMQVAGQANQVGLAFELQADMVAQGLQPSQVTYNVLIMVCIDNQQLDRAGEVHDLSIQAGLHPDAHAYNALINAYGSKCQFGNAVSLVQDMVKGGLQPDQFTFTAILNACQRANEAEVAFEVFRLMQQRKVLVDDTICFILLRLCFNRLRQEWYPGGYPPKPDQPIHRLPGETSPAGSRLLQVLSGRTEGLDLPENVNWVSRAMLVYRQGLTHGLRPSLKMLDKLLSCLRLPFIPPLGSEGAPSSVPSCCKGSHLPRGSAQYAELAQQEANSIAYDPSAVTILEEAITLGVLPPFRLDAPCRLDMTQMPPSVAEVYVLAMVAAIKRGSLTKAYTGALQPITFFVQPYDPAKVYFPSYAQDFSTQVRGPPMQSLDSHDEEEQALLDELMMNPLIASAIVPLTPSASSTPEQTSSSQSSSNNTALGVVGMLRRLKLWTHEDAHNGKLTILPRSIAEWLRSTNRAAANIRSQAPMHQQQWIGQSIADQQRQLRSGQFSRNNKTSGKGRNQQGRGRQHHKPDPIVWNDIQSNTRKYEDLDFDE